MAVLAGAGYDGAVAVAQRFGGLGTGGLIVVIVVAIVLIVAVVWLISGTSRHD
ncbi:MAG: hypothetical protein J7K94_01120 [Dehalococcoidia bacterium]|nr:hypothetical protein [Dehalococcoidia bacterium]